MGSDRLPGADMITLFDPRLWAAAILCIGLSFFAGSWHGADVATEKARVAEAGRTAKALAALAEENDKEMAKERVLRTADRTALNKFTKEHDDAQAQTDRLIADLRHDVVRLRIPIRAPRAAQADAGGPPSSRTGEEGHSELSQDGAEFLVGLLARGDEGIRKHAEVVDRYERLRVACTSDSPTDVPTQGNSP